MQYVVLRGPTRSAGRTSHTILPVFCPFTSVWFYRFHELAGIRQFCSCTTRSTHIALLIFISFCRFFLIFLFFIRFFQIFNLVQSASGVLLFSYCCCCNSFLLLFWQTSICFSNGLMWKSESYRYRLQLSSSSCFQFNWAHQMSTRNGSEKLTFGFKLSDFSSSSLTGLRIIFTINTQRREESQVRSRQLNEFPLNSNWNCVVF